MATTPNKTPARAAAAVKVDPTLVLLTAIEPIRHDGADMAPGETFACDPAVAEVLLAAGAAEIAPVA